MRRQGVPRALSLFGLAAVFEGLGGIVLEFLGYSVSIFFFLPILPFELAIGFWLVLKGINAGAEPEALFPGTPTAMPVKPTVA